jgi:hypothetical protein
LKKKSYFSIVFKTNKTKMFKKELIGVVVALVAILALAISSIVLTSLTKKSNVEVFDDNDLIISTNILTVNEIDSENTNVINNETNDLIYSLPKNGGFSGNMLTVDDDNGEVLKFDNSKDLEGPLESFSMSVAIFGELSENSTVQKLKSSNVEINEGSIKATKYTVEDYENTKIFSLAQTAGDADMYLELVENKNTIWKTEDTLKTPSDVTGPSSSKENSICTFDGTSGKEITTSANNFSDYSTVDNNGKMIVKQFEVSDISLVKDFTSEERILYSIPFDLGEPNQTLAKDSNNKLNWTDIKTANVFIDKVSSKDFLVPSFKNNIDGEIQETNVFIKNNKLLAKAVIGQKNENLTIQANAKNEQGSLFVGAVNDPIIVPITINGNGLFYNCTFIENDPISSDDEILVPSSPVVCVTARGKDCKLKFPEITEDNPFAGVDLVPVGTSINICNISSNNFNLIIPAAELSKSDFDIILYPGTACKVTALSKTNNWSFFGEDKLIKNGLRYQDYDEATNTSIIQYQRGTARSFSPIILKSAREFVSFKINQTNLPEEVVFDPTSGEITISQEFEASSDFSFEVCGFFESGYVYTTNIIIQIFG